MDEQKERLDELLEIVSALQVSDSKKASEECDTWLYMRRLMQRNTLHNALVSLAHILPR